MEVPVSLGDLIGLPIRPRVSFDWEGISEDYGIGFPSDYKDLMETYPTLLFYDFLMIIPIEGPGRIWRFLERLQEGIDGNLPVGPEYVPPAETPGEPVGRFAVYPEPGGLFPWAHTENEQIVCWLTGPEPDLWTVVVFNEDGGWWHYRGSTTSFLYETMTGSVLCPVWTDEFPDEWRDIIAESMGSCEIRQIEDPSGPLR
ncbi:hypothetical protein GCM10027589_00840 [Actinocorallia lasiicapitis]